MLDAGTTINYFEVNYQRVIPPRANNFPTRCTFHYHYYSVCRPGRGTWPKKFHSFMHLIMKNFSEFLILIIFFPLCPSDRARVCVCECMNVREQENGKCKWKYEIRATSAQTRSKTYNEKPAAYINKKNLISIEKHDVQTNCMSFAEWALGNTIMKCSSRASSSARRRRGVHQCQCRLGFVATLSLLPVEHPSAVFRAVTH